MYIKASSDDANLYRYHPVRKEITKIELKTPQNTSQMAISEEGRFILSSRNSDSSEIYDYNLRKIIINRIFVARTMHLFDVLGEQKTNTYFGGGYYIDGLLLVAA